MKPEQTKKINTLARLSRLGKNNFIGKCSAIVCNRPIAEQGKKGVQAGASH